MPIKPMGCAQGIDLFTRAQDNFWQQLGRWTPQWNIYYSSWWPWVQEGVHGTLVNGEPRYLELQ